MIYLDYAASTPLGDQAYKTLMEAQKSDFANPSSAHKLGKKISQRIEEAREKWSSFLKAPKGFQFLFTSSATESNNMAINGLSWEPGDEVLYSSADHASMVEPCEWLREKREVFLKEIPLAFGRIDQESFFEKVSGNEKALFLTLVNGQTGVFQDLNSLIKKVREANPSIFIHIDASQAFGKFPFSFEDWDVDSLAVSSHKIGGPKGVSGLYLKSLEKIGPLMKGGGHEFNLRPSTLAAPLIFSFTEQAKDCLAKLKAGELERKKELYQYLIKGIKSFLPKALFPFEKGGNGPYILTCIIPGISSDIILRHLEEKEIYISSRSACSSRVKGVVPVFKSLGIPESQHKNVLRISISYETTQAHVDTFLQELEGIMDELSFLLK